MNLYQGQLISNNQIAQYMSDLPKLIDETLSKPLLSSDIVINACDQMVALLPDEKIMPMLEGLNISKDQAVEALKDLRLMFSGKYLRQRLQIELGANHGEIRRSTPLDIDVAVSEQIYPLGVLLHIAAGNADGLPAYSVIEGLLAGNINLLKLPAVDGGLTVMLLKKLCEIEPLLAEYIYVFELSSKDASSIHQLAELADGIVVWGGNEAVAAIRKMVSPNTRIIEWGHKLSFAYVTKAGLTYDKLEGLAHNICLTNQLLCSSCQGVFIDTLSDNEAQDFCRIFLLILEKAAKEYPDIPLSAKAQNTLQLHSRKLEEIYGDTAQIFKGTNTSLILERDNRLSPSMQYRNVWVKKLTQQQILKHLHPYKNYLQTAALLCGGHEWEILRDKLWRAGVVRISDGKRMSRSYCGAPHDGDYPLRRYTRIVSAWGRGY